MTQNLSIEEMNPELKGIGRYEFGWADKDDAGAAATRGLNEDVVRDISGKKSEPQWMLDLRLKGLKLFHRKPMPTWGSDLGGIDFDNIKYFVRSSEKQATSWEDLPEDIKNTYDKLGIPEAEKQRLVAGVAAQYESEVVYHSIREDLEEKGVIFVDTDTALKEHEELFKEYFGTVIPVGDNKFAALNTSVWSGGSFIYVPKGVHVDIREDDVSMGHEASVSKVSDDQLFYLMSRGMEQDEAMAMIVRGFVEPIAKELPMEYALELNRLIELQMEGAVG